MRKYFKCSHDDNGDNWLIATLGTDRDGREYALTTYEIHASDLNMFSLGAKGDGQLLADLLNWYYNTEDAPEIIHSFSENLAAKIGG